MENTMGNIMKNIFESKAVVLDKNIDTDQIYPGRYLAIVEPQEIGKHCLEGIKEELRRHVPNSVIVAGTNFGCGSSREHAVIALMSAGVKAVIAESFARIFFRNAINLGLPLLTCKSIGGRVETGHVLAVDVANGLVTDKDTGETFESERLGSHIMEIIEAGGIKSLMRRKRGNL